MNLTTTAAPSRSATADRRTILIGAGILFVASGASGLMLEVVWSRMLGWLLGATTWSVMAILVAFMGGLGLARSSGDAGRAARLARCGSSG